LGDNPRQVQQTASNLAGTTSGTTTGTTAGTTTQALAPYGPTTDILNNLLAQLRGVSPSLTPGQSTALTRLQDIGAAGQPFAPAISNVATTLLSGGGPDRTAIPTEAYDKFRTLLTPTATGAYLDPNTNPFFGQTTSDITGSTLAGLKSLYAGSGRDPALAGPDFQYNVGKGVGAALAPAFSSAYATERGNQLNAINSLLTGATGTTGVLSALDQARLNAMTAGIPAAGAAFDATTAGPLLQLQAASQAAGIPVSNLATLLGITVPIAGQFGTTTGTQAGTTAGQQLGTTNQIQTGTTTTQTQVPLWQQILGGGALAAGTYGLLNR
jgi:hypothetical protein